MSSLIETSVPAAQPASAAPTTSLSPGRRAWLRFKRNRLGFWSLAVFSVLVVLSLFAEVLSTDRQIDVIKRGR